MVTGEDRAERAEAIRLGRLAEQAGAYFEEWLPRARRAAVNALMRANTLEDLIAARELFAALESVERDRLGWVESASDAMEGDR